MPGTHELDFLFATNMPLKLVHPLFRRNDVERFAAVRADLIGSTIFEFVYADHLQVCIVLVVL